MQLLWILRRHKTGLTEKLWSMLKTYGVGRHLLKGIQAFYKEATACVRVGGEFSENAVETGVRQGCVMSPFFFFFFFLIAKDTAKGPKKMEKGPQLAAPYSERVSKGRSILVAEMS